MRTFLCLAMVTVAFGAAGEDLAWNKLFPNDSLDGWQAISGQWTFKNGALIGTASDGKPAVLLSNQAYEHVDVGVKLHTQNALQGGVLLWAHYLPEHPDGTADPKPRIVYGEGTLLDTTGAAAKWVTKVCAPMDSALEPPTEPALDPKDGYHSLILSGNNGQITTTHVVTGLKKADLRNSDTTHAGRIAFEVVPNGSEAATLEFGVPFVRAYPQTGETALIPTSLDGLTKIGAGDWSLDDGVLAGKSTSDSEAGCLLFNQTLPLFRIRMKFKLEGDCSGGLVYFAAKDDDGVRGMRVALESKVPGPTGWLAKASTNQWFLKHDPATLGAYALHPDDWNTLEIYGSQTLARVWVNGLKVYELRGVPAADEQGDIALCIDKGTTGRLLVRDLALVAGP